MALIVKWAYGQFVGCPEVPGSCWYIFIYSLRLWPKIRFSWLYAYYSWSIIDKQLIHIMLHFLLLWKGLINTKLKNMLDKYVNLHPVICNVFSMGRKQEMIFLLHKLRVLSKKILLLLGQHLNQYIDDSYTACLLLLYLYLNKYKYFLPGKYNVYIPWTSLLNNLLLFWSEWNKIFFHFPLKKKKSV